jgi:DHA1 family tetracycline resistance protein-like MFS transporter
VRPMRKATLGTIFLTVFLDLLGFGLVVPYLPGVARELGASSFTATLLGASYSLMQLFFVPFWGQMSDRTGRRPVLLVSVGASAVGFLILANAGSLWMLFAARIWNGIATSNLAVAQAYIADVTPPEDRAKGMGLIGTGIGLGFVFGPVLGGLLEAVSPLPRGALPAYVGFGLALLNFTLALARLPESLPPERRGEGVRRASPLDPARYRAALRFPGTGVALVVNLVLVLSFASMEQTFRLFTEDAFHIDTRATGLVLGFVGVIMVVVQGALIRPLSRALAERTLVVFGVLLEAAGFLALSQSPRAGSLVALYAAVGLIALGSGLANPSLSAFASRCADAASQGVVLGVLQSAGAFARVCGPAVGGALYQAVGYQAPYLASAGGMALAAALALQLRRPAPVPAASAPAPEAAPR